MQFFKVIMYSLINAISAKYVEKEQEPIVTYTPSVPSAVHVPVTEQSYTDAPTPSPVPVTEQSYTQVPVNSTEQSYTQVPTPVNSTYHIPSSTSVILSSSYQYQDLSTLKYLNVVYLLMAFM